MRAVKRAFLIVCQLVVTTLCFQETVAKHRRCEASSRSCQRSSAGARRNVAATQHPRSEDVAGRTSPTSIERRLRTQRERDFLRALTTPNNKTL